MFDTRVKAKLAVETQPPATVNEVVSLFRTAHNPSEMAQFTNSSFDAVHMRGLMDSPTLRSQLGAPQRKALFERLCQERDRLLKPEGKLVSFHEEF